LTHWRHRVNHHADMGPFRRQALCGSAGATLRLILDITPPRGDSPFSSSRLLSPRLLVVSSSPILRLLLLCLLDMPLPLLRLLLLCLLDIPLFFSSSPRPLLLFSSSPSPMLPSAPSPLSAFGFTPRRLPSSTLAPGRTPAGTRCARCARNLPNPPAATRCTRCTPCARCTRCARCTHLRQHRHRAFTSIIRRLSLRRHSHQARDGRHEQNLFPQVHRLVALERGDVEGRRGAGAVHWDGEGEPGSDERAGEVEWAGDVDVEEALEVG
jgi:hypothetical protein